MPVVQGHSVRTQLNPILQGVAHGGEMKTKHPYIFICVLCALFFLTTAAAAQADCLDHAQKRSPKEVLQDHVSALLSGDLDLIACDYGEDAVIITPGKVISGHKEIKDYYASIFQLMGGPGTLGAVSVTTTGTVLLLEWTLNSPHLVVNDGTDTFVVEKGRISYQTVKLGDVVVH